MKHKNPQVKQETALFLVRSLRSVRTIPKSAEIKQLCDACTVLLADTAKPVRSAGAEAMGTLMKMIGERAMTPYISDLDDIRKNMITEFCETATVRAKPEKVAAPPPPAVAAKAPTQARGVVRSRPSAAGAKRQSGTPTISSGKIVEPSSSSRIAAPGAHTSRIGMSNGLRKKTEDPASAASPRVVRTSSATSGTPPRSTSGRGLTGVSLSSSASTSGHGGLSAADKLELIELRRAKEEWLSSNAALQQQVDTLQAETTKLTREVADLQLNNAQLIEEHTRDMLSVQSKETQLTRIRGEADNARAQISKLQRELDRARAESQLVGRQSASSPNGIDSRDAKEHSQSSLQARQSSTIRTSDEEKENEFGRVQPSAAKRASVYSGSQLPKPGSFSPQSDGTDGRISNAGSVESWKRAAEVTSQLKARIEAMKARQLRR